MVNANYFFLVAYIQKNYPLLVTEAALLDGKLVLQVPSDRIVELLRFLRDDEKLQFSQLVDVFATDYPRKSKRFELNYVLLSLCNRCRLLVKTSLPQDHVVSVSSIFSSAVWLEREVWDMLGIFFYDHPDLRRILTDYGFEGYPLRKDFPLSGYSEVRYDEEKKKIVSEPLRLSQEFRYFDFVSPWADSGAVR